MRTMGKNSVPANNDMHSHHLRLLVYRQIVQCSLLVVSLALVGIDVAWGEKVTEAGTGKPIPGAIVAFHRQIQPWESAYCFDVGTAKTDKKGRYHIPFSLRSLISTGYQIYAYKKGYRDIWESGILAGLSGNSVGIYAKPNLSTSATAHSLGMDVGTPYQVDVGNGIKELAYNNQLPVWWSTLGLDVMFVPDTSDPISRLKYLLKLANSTDCYSAGSRNKNLLPLYEAMSDEAINIAATKEGKKVAAEICLKLGSAATFTDGGTSSEEDEKQSLAYLRGHYPRCWDTVVEASSTSTRIVSKSCDAMRRCTTRAFIKSCNLRDGCSEVEVESIAEPQIAPTEQMIGPPPGFVMSDSRNNQRNGR